MPEPHHRRQFVRTLALGGTAGVLIEPAPTPADDPPAQEKPRSEADARLDLVLARFGKHLNDDARKAVRAEVEAIVRRAESLRKLPIDNGDGPFPVFTPYRGPLAGS